MIQNNRSKIILERDYSIGSHQSGIYGRWKTKRSGLVGEWNLDGSAIDTSGNGNDGITTNIVYATTEVGYHSQNGVWSSSDDGSIQIPTASTIFGTGNFSVSAWIYVGGNPGSNQVHGIVAFGSTGSVPAFQFDLWNDGGTMKIRGVTYANASYQTVAPYTINLNDGKYHHVVFQVSGATLTIFIDNNQVSSGTHTGTRGADNTTSKRIGSDFLNQATTRFNGNIQYVRIISSDISNSEIRNYYLEGLKLLH